MPHEMSFFDKVGIRLTAAGADAWRKHHDEVFALIPPASQSMCPIGYTLEDGRFVLGYPKAGDLIVHRLRDIVTIFGDFGVQSGMYFEKSMWHYGLYKGLGEREKPPLT